METFLSVFLFRDSCADQYITQKCTTPARVRNGTLGPLDTSHFLPGVFLHLGTTVTSTLDRVVGVFVLKTAEMTYDESSHDHLSWKGCDHVLDVQYLLFHPLHFAVYLDRITVKLRCQILYHSCGFHEIVISSVRG